MGVILRAESLRRSYGGPPVVDLDALEVARGEVVAVLGPNGAGKSTLFRLLLLIERADAGRILLDGREVRAGETPAMRRMSGVFQKPFLFSGTVRSNVGFGLRARGVPRREVESRIEDALDWVGLRELADAPVDTLSGGEAQRVAVARALAPEPDIVLLDEPTANLDITIQRRFREDLQRLVRSRAGAAVVITHDPADAMTLADRIVVLERGRIVQSGTPTELVLHPATSFVAAFTGAELILHGIVESREGDLVTVRVGRVLVVAASHDRAEALDPGSPAHVTYRPEDVVLSPAEGGAAATSARNRYVVRVVDAAPSGALLRIRLSGDIELVSLVTRGSAEALGIGPGRELVAQLKATALRAYPAPRAVG